jgi:metallopeptidase family M12-like protein
MKTIISALFALSVLAGIAGVAPTSAGPNHWQATRIIVHLNDHTSIAARRTRLEGEKNGWTWRGEIDETGEPVMMMWWKEGRFSGMLTYRGDMYTLSKVTKIETEVHTLAQPNIERMPARHASVRSHDHRRDRAGFEGRREPSRPMGILAYAGREVPALSLAERQALAAKKITIDVMILYTSKVASKYLDVEKDVAAHSIEEANASFVNSDIGNVKLRLVHSQEINYDESQGEHFNHLYRMVDGVESFANVKALRDEKRADVVVLIVDDPSGCGLATRVAADAEEAFAVVHHTCAVLTYSVPHEIGHILGARHDASLDETETPFSYGHGYVNGTKWRDIMSYKSSCGGCPRLAVWSNPTIKFRGEPAGTALADNARVILEQADRVSKFR